MATSIQPVSAPAKLAPHELRAWRGLLRAHAALTKALDAELEAAHGLPLSSYEVLLHLNETSGEAMRMCDLATSVILSRSGLTRLVDRLEREGLVERRSCPQDARGSYAVLTDLGRERLRAQGDELRRLIRRADAVVTEYLDAEVELVVGVDEGTAATRTAAALATAPDDHGLPAALSRRELEVLALLGKGASNAQIAAQLVISEETAKTHVKRILRKLGAANRLEAATMWLRAKAER